MAKKVIIIDKRTKKYVCCGKEDKKSIFNKEKEKEGDK